MLTSTFVKNKVIKLLPIDSDLYSDQLEILVKGAMSKLKNEGVDASVINETDDNALDYCICVSYQLAIDLDADADVERLMKQYITRVNTLRLALNV